MFTASQKDKQWNQNVQERIDSINKIVTWLKGEQKYAVEHKDWYTARGLGRVVPLLEFATNELYDMQYFEDEQWVNNWRKSQCVDPLE